MQASKWSTKNTTRTSFAAIAPWLTKCQRHHLPTPFYKTSSLLGLRICYPQHLKCLLYAQFFSFFFFLFLFFQVSIRMFAPQKSFPDPGLENRPPSSHGHTVGLSPHSCPLAAFSLWHNPLSWLPGSWYIFCTTMQACKCWGLICLWHALYPCALNTANT